MNKKGFTLIELMVVMAIIAVLVVLAIGAITIARRTATETTHRANQRTVQTALEGAFAKYKAYCGTNTDQVSCTVGALTHNFKAAATKMGATVSATTTLGTCAAGLVNDGGGTITAIDPNGYTLTPQNYNCSAAGTEAITVP